MHGLHFQHRAKMQAVGQRLFPQDALEQAMEKQGKEAAHHEDQQANDNGEQAAVHLPVRARQPVDHWRAPSRQPA
ncbi:hypothetical protein D3C87_1831440 [compost metagenome]